MKCQLPTVTYICSFHIFIKENIGTENGIKVEDKQKSIFYTSSLIELWTLFDLKNGLHFYALPDIPV